MYLYFVVSIIAFMYCSLKLISNRESKAEVISVLGVDEDGNHRVIDKNSNLDDYGYFKLNYILRNEKYCLVSEDVPYIEDVDVDTSDAKRCVKSATMYVNDMEIDMTEQIRQIAGPRCDFHGQLIDFNWIFEKCVGTLAIDFTDARVDIDVESNTVNSGPNDIIPMIEYVHIDSEIELD